MAKIVVLTDLDQLLYHCFSIGFEITLGNGILNNLREDLFAVFITQIQICVESCNLIHNDGAGNIDLCEMLVITNILHCCQSDGNIAGQLHKQIILLMKCINIARRIHFQYHIGT